MTGELPPVDAHTVLDRVAQLVPHVVERVVAELQLQAVLAVDEPDGDEPKPPAS